MPAAPIAVPSRISRRSTMAITPSQASCITVAGNQRADAEPDTNPTESSPAIFGSVTPNALSSSGLRNHATIRVPTAMAAVSEPASANSGSRATPRPLPPRMPRALHRLARHRPGRR